MGRTLSQSIDLSDPVIQLYSVLQLCLDRLISFLYSNLQTCCMLYICQFIIALRYRCLFRILIWELRHAVT